MYLEKALYYNFQVKNINNLNVLDAALNMLKLIYIYTYIELDIRISLDAKTGIN